MKVTLSLLILPLYKAVQISIYNPYTFPKSKKGATLRRAFLNQFLAEIDLLILSFII